MPRGPREPGEALLESFGPLWTPSHEAWSHLSDWWLRHKRGANTPNWDIVLGCTVDDRPGLVLVEAKANWPEMKVEGKHLREDASERSLENHIQIGRAIDEARSGWQRIDPRISISRDTHYQLANRLAYTWKLGMLGIPVVLMYLGFTGDEGIRDVGASFSDHEDWNRAFSAYVANAVPLELFDRRIELGLAPVWLVSRSRPVLEMSPRVNV